MGLVREPGEVAHVKSSTAPGSYRGSRKPGRQDRSSSVLKAQRLKQKSMPKQKHLHAAWKMALVVTQGITLDLATNRLVSSLFRTYLSAIIIVTIMVNT